MNKREECTMTNKDELKGKITETKGKLTGDESEELKGKLQQEYGKAKEKAEEAIDEVSKKLNEFFDKKDK